MRGKPTREELAHELVSSLLSPRGVQLGGDPMISRAVETIITLIEEAHARVLAARIREYYGAAADLIDPDKEWPPTETEN